MSRWVTSAPPKAAVTQQGVSFTVPGTNDVTTIYVTAFGKRFAKTVEHTGFVLWQREINTP